MLAAGQHDANAQGFLGKIKNVGKQIEKKVENTLDRKTPKSKVPVANNKKKSDLDKQVDAMVGARNNRNAEDAEATARIPKVHTALLAPLGYDAAPEFGVKTVTPVRPPAKADKQVAWRDKMPNPETLTNASLVDMYNMLKNAGDYADMSLSPAAHYASLVDEVINSRIEAIEKMKEGMDEAMSEYDDPEAYNWVINNSHSMVVRAISSDAYKHLVRSSLEPLFTLERKFDDYAAMTAYFTKHGGVKNAHKAAWTKWDPEPNKEKVNTSTGAKGTVMGGNATGGTIDMNGIYYSVQTKERRAFVKNVATAALTGKDVVIPSYVEYKGVKYPVTFIAASAFENAKINSVVLPSSLKEIRHKAFRATNIKELVVPASVNRVEGSAFAFCPNLTKVTFASTSMELIEGCFAGCQKLQSVTFPASLARDMTYDMFFNCPMLTTVVLPKNLRTIPSQMFSGCKSLRKIELPTTVTKIDKLAFKECPVTDLNIPNVTEIDDAAFLDCRTLKTININKTLLNKLTDENYWLYTTNFSTSPALQLTVNNGKIGLPAGVKVVK